MKMKNRRDCKMSVLCTHQAAHPQSCHPWRVFGNKERERKRIEKRENEGQKQGLVTASFQKLELRSTVFYIGLYSLTNM